MPNHTNVGVIELLFESDAFEEVKVIVLIVYLHVVNDIVSEPDDRATELIQFLKIISVDLLVSDVQKVLVDC